MYGDELAKYECLRIYNESQTRYVPSIFSTWRAQPREGKIPDYWYIDNHMAVVMKWCGM